MPDFFDVVRSQRGIRYYKPDPVPDEAIEQVLRAAVRAPSGSNRQPWKFIVIRDPAVKREMGRIYLLGQAKSRGLSESPKPPEGQPLTFAFDMEHVPALIMACTERAEGNPSLAYYASIYPAVQNLMLAAAALGLGTRLTTIWQHDYEEVAKLLGIPGDYQAMALIPLGYPREPDHLGGSKRKPVREVTFYDKWGQAKG